MSASLVFAYWREVSRDLLRMMCRDGKKESLRLGGCWSYYIGVGFCLACSPLQLTLYDMSQTLPGAQCVNFQRTVPEDLASLLIDIMYW